MSARRKPGRVTFRSARPSDLHALVAIENTCFRSELITPRQLRYLLARPSAEFVLAEHGGEPLGYALVLFRAGASVARVYSLAVLPEARGAGLGRALMNECLRRGKRRGCRLARLEVRAKDRKVRALYESLGFSVTGTLERYYEDGASGVRMQAPL